MKTTQIIFVLTSMYFSTLTFASEDLSIETKQKVALATCLQQAEERYGSVSENSEPKKKKIGKIKGHAYELRVGTSQKRVNCIADAKGKSIFYNGRI